jgi:hypothetical protein
MPLLWPSPQTPKRNKKAVCLPFDIGLKMMREMHMQLSSMSTDWKAIKAWQLGCQFWLSYLDLHNCGHELVAAIWYLDRYCSREARSNMVFLLAGPTIRNVSANSVVFQFTYS